MRIKTFITLAFLLSTFIVKGQNDYFSTDSASLYGIDLIDDGDIINSQLCQVKKGDTIIRYTPYEVKEFGFKDGRVYVSKEIYKADSSEKVFLERLYKGKTTLYFYKKNGIQTFFIAKDSTLLVEIPKQNATGEDYSQQLSGLTNDCPNVLDACKLVNYNTKSLSKFFLWYNTCEAKPFTHFRYGILFGYEHFALKSPSESNEDLAYLDFNYTSGLSLGLFIDSPIGVSAFSFRPELMLSKHNYSYHKSLNGIDLDFKADVTSLNIPLLLRYTYPSNNIHPFINAGVIGMFGIRNNTSFNETIYENNRIVVNDLTIETMSAITNFKTGETLYYKVPRHLIPNLSFGYCFGGGIEFNLNYKNSLFFEIRYNNTFGLKKYEIQGIYGFNVISGINF